MSQVAIDSIDTAPADSPKRAAIVAAATKLFLSLGFGSVSMDRIAAEAEVSKRTVYSHFENKETLFAAVMGAVCESIVGDVPCPLDSEDSSASPPEALLHRTGIHFLTIVTSEMGIELHRLVSAESERFPELGQTFYDNGPGMVFRNVREFLDQQVAQGTLDIADTMLATRQFFAMIIQPVQMELSIGVRKTISAKEIETIVGQAVDVFRKLYAKPAA